MNFLNKLKNYALGSGVELAIAIIYMLVGYMLIRIIISLLKRSVNRAKIEKTIPNFIISILNIVLIIVLVVSVLKFLGISTESVVTIASVISLGISLALQDVIKGIANGFLLVTTKPFVEGEYVKIGDVEGTIISISMFNTVLKTTDVMMITYPNSQAINSSIKNFSRLPVRRISLNIPVAYGSKTEEIKKLVLDVVKKQKNILNNPAPSVRLTEYGDSNLVYTLKCWTQCENYWSTLYDLNEQILDALIDANISIDYNQLDVHIKDMPNKKEEL